MTKTFARRDSATSVLRKLGVKPRDYDLFISRGEHPLGGEFPYLLNLDLAKSHVATIAVQTGAAQDEAPPKQAGKTTDPIQAPAPKQVKKHNGAKFDVHTEGRLLVAGPGKFAAEKRVKTKAAVKTAKNPVGREGTCSAVARQLILDGQTNQQVWDAISVQFQLSDSKRLYPSWYRRELRLKGLI